MEALWRVGAALIVGVPDEVVAVPDARLSYTYLESVDFSL
jgi:hypothetical protein